MQNRWRVIIWVFYLVSCALSPTLLYAAENEPRTAFSGSYKYSGFPNNEPWHEGSMEITRKTDWLGSFIGRLNYARRFGRTGLQVEIDAYPKIQKGSYVFLNYGYSPLQLFPVNRYSGELFSSLGGGREFSIGFRFLEFPSSQVLIYTGSYGIYFGNNWLSFRPYITPKSEGISTSTNVILRMYGRDADEYMEYTFGAGFAPTDTLTDIDLDRIDSYKIGIGGKTPMGRNIIWKWSMQYSYEQLSANRTRNQFDIGGGISWGL